MERISTISGNYDTIIIGGGFFGCMLAERTKGKVLIIEKESLLLNKASLNNQARVHNGYHYPRSFATASSSHRNYLRFCKEFKNAIFDTYSMLYPIAKGSKVSVEDYKDFYTKVGSPLKKVNWQGFFNSDLIEEVFEGEESVFDAVILRSILYERLKKKNVDILFDSEVKAVEEGYVFVNTLDKRRVYSSPHIISCAYAGTNTLLGNSGLPLLPLRHERTVMPIVQVPDEYSGFGITIMDGDYFSIMPFPIRGAHSIHHVKYTPQGGDFKAIYEDVVQYMPNMCDMVLKGEIREDKVILEVNDKDDGRPILYRKDYGFKGFDVVVGAKLDNIYDLLDFNNGAEFFNIV